MTALASNLNSAKVMLSLIPSIIRYKFHRSFNSPKSMPINVTVSITNTCNSRCKTCFIWRLYRDKPELKEKEFKTWEFERTFESIEKSVFWATISGGEPYLRLDLPEICAALCEYCKPRIINIPTNALLPETIEDKTKKILEECVCSTLIVNLSLDGVGSKHDEIRGVQGNFERFLETHRRLKELKAEFPHLQIGIHSVVSRYSINGLLEVYEYAKKLDVDSYITEVAEQRTELFTMNKDIAPNPSQYASFVGELSCRIRDNYLHSKSLLSKVTQAFRLTYYPIAVQQIQEHRQITPCYAGYASCQITPYGEVWPCCILGYDKPMGNIREADYDFKRVWFSKKADDVRKYIKGKNCACPLANAHYTNMFCNFTSLIRVILSLI